MSGATAATYIAGAVAANTVYGLATGESGGLVGEAFGVQDKIDSQQAQAKQDALDRANAAQARQDAANKANADAIASTASLISNPPVTVTAAAATPPTVTKPAVMPSIDLQKARRTTIMEQRKRQGRASTILTADTLGG